MSRVPLPSLSMISQFKNNNCLMCGQRGKCEPPWFQLGEEWFAHLCLDHTHGEGLKRQRSKGQVIRWGCLGLLYVCLSPGNSGVFLPRPGSESRSSVCKGQLLAWP